jgi:uncharacterized membrane protein
MDRGRLEAFSDGVFAVAITILALDLVVPQVSAGHSLLRGLAHEWPSLAAYVVSFLTIGIIWVNHHVLVKNIAVVDRPLLFINLLLLMVVVLIPFSTATFSAYLTTPGWNGRVAALFYAAVLEAMALTFLLLYRWCAKEEGRVHDTGRLQLDKVGPGRGVPVGVAAYLVALVAALVWPPATLLVTAAVALFYALGPELRAGREAESASD